MNIQRKRWVIERFGDGAILCGTAGHHHFELPDKLLNCNIRTFASEKLAESAAKQANCYGAKVIRILEVVESIEDIGGGLLVCSNQNNDTDYAPVFVFEVPIE